MVFQQFTNFVNAQPDDREIHHFTPEGRGPSWDMCSVGDFKRDAGDTLDPSLETSIDVSQELRRSERYLLPEHNQYGVMSRLNGMDATPHTYGELKALITQFHPELS